MRLIGVRYSLRTLLLVMAVGPAAVYWAGLPTLNAHRYAAAIDAEDYLAADRLCVDQQRSFPGEAKDWLSFSAHARLQRLSRLDILSGQGRRLVYHQEHVDRRVVLVVG